MSRYTLNENPLRVQIRVICALILRETRVTFGTAQLGYLWAIANPVFGTAILVFIFSLISRLPPIGTSFVLFFATGILPYELYRKLAASLMNVFSANQGLLAYPLVKELDVVYARSLLIIATYLLVMIIFFSTLVIFGITNWPADLTKILSAISALALMGLGVGVCNAVLKGLWKAWVQIEAIISRPMFFISGIFFIPTLFPPHIRDLLAWNPVLHCIEWFREGYYGSYESVILDKGYIFTWIICVLLAGFGGERLYRKKMT